MRYIERWSLMRNSRSESLAEHALDVAVISHCLATIANVRYHRNLDADRAALIGMYHDASEIITGDMPTPVKYANSEIRDAYHQVEARAEKTILSTLPEDLQDAYAQVLTHSTEASESEVYLRKLIKAADKIAALIKCIEEAQSGNSEFITAEASTRGVVEDLADSLPEVHDFMTEFLPSYGETLDQLL
jgi:metal dependent phosphohydrolase